jgi:hypothetical protein
MAKQSDRFMELARIGAAIRRAQIVAELRAIDKAFPGLKFQKRTAALLTPNGSITSTTAGSVAGPSAQATRKRRKLSAAEKKFISERMKKYWADRKRKAS